MTSGAYHSVLEWLICCERPNPGGESRTLASAPGVHPVEVAFGGLALVKTACVASA